MNRKQRKEQVRKLQNQCELIKKQAEKDIENAKELFSKKEDLYLEHIQILNERLMDGKHYVTERICVNVAKENPWMYEDSRVPFSVLERYQETSEYQTLLGENKEISKWYVDINTIEDLVALEKEIHNSLIINDGEILIYDDYVE